jgi:hypothetical protein
MLLRTFKYGFVRSRFRRDGSMMAIRSGLLVQAMHTHLVMESSL